MIILIGEHRLVVERRKVRYEITIRHKLSIIQGDSGTGKTYLSKMIFESTSLGQYANISIRCDLKVYAVTSLETMRNAINDGYQLLVIDETYFRPMTMGDSGESVARLIKDKPVYCIFITRDAGYTSLPVDVDACYTLQYTTKGSKVIVTNEQLYDWKNEGTIKPSIVYTEDTKVGHSFFKRTLPDCKVIGVGGTGNLKKLLMHKLESDISGNDAVVIIADGCAFGMVMSYYVLLKNKLRDLGIDIRLYIPPPFEYMILDSGIIPKVDKSRLQNAFMYAKIEKYMSFEKYYEDYLYSITNGKLGKNSTALLRFILVKRNTDKIYAYIGEIER